jgi:competence protein ComEC
LTVSLDLAVGIVVGSLVLWFAARIYQPDLTTINLWLCFAGLAAAHHHTHRRIFPTDDIGHAAGLTPVVAKVRGTIDEPPVIRRANPTDLYGPYRKTDRATTVLAAREVYLSANWQPVSGRVRLSVERVIKQSDSGFLDSVQIGDEVEVVGLLSRPAAPANPGELDYADYLLDRRIQAELRVAKGNEAVTRLGTAGWTWDKTFMSFRSRLTRLLDESLPSRKAALARALLLGDRSAMDRSDWDAFARTGVVHVLAISGLHLGILAGFVWVVLRAIDLRRRHGAWIVMALVIAYAAFTGLRPSALRAALMVCGVCLGLVLRRPVLTANIFAAAWLAVVAFDPTDPFSVGCQLSFICVFALIWGAGRWLTPRSPTPLEQLIDESRPTWLRILRWLGRFTLTMYAVTLFLLIVSAPLVMLNMNIVPPIGVLLGPPVIVLTAVVLLVGFLALLIGLMVPVLAVPFIIVTGWLLTLIDGLVRIADNLPGTSVYVPSPPVWWVVGFYVFVVAVVLLSEKWCRRALLAMAGWAILGLVGIPDDRGDELRVTFLSVGHGGCTVLECPDGRVLMYDAGTMSGPDAVRRTIAPFLWHRGVRRIDELFLSHADIDHYNAVPDLLRRFPVGRVTLTPSFADKPTAEVADTLLALDRHAVPRQIAFAGHRLTAGAVEIQVLHPPQQGPSGSENERSLVLLVRHAGHTILLTGDLEKQGTAYVLELPPIPIDVMMAPHHGSRPAFPPALWAWANPRLVVVSRGQREGAVTGENVWATWTHGAVTLCSNPTGLTAQAFKTNKRKVIRRGD